MVPYNDQVLFLAQMVKGSALMVPTDLASAYTITELSQKDYPAIMDLWAFAFNITKADARTGDEKFRDFMIDYCKNGVSYFVGAYDDNTLAAVAGICDFDMHLGDQWVKCGGIAGVATYPEYRRQRLVKVLLTQCLKKLHAEKAAVSSLWPFSHSFYERMGWSVTDMHYLVELGLSGLKKGNRGKANSYRCIDLPNLGDAARLHEEWSHRLNLSIRRNQYRWQRMLEDSRFRRRLYLHDEGYMFFSMAQSSQGRLMVDEWCYLSHDAFEDGLALLAQMDSQFDKVSLKLPEVESVLKLAGLGSKPIITLKPGMMSRVVHLDSFLEALGGRNQPAVEVVDPLGVTAHGSDENVLSRGPGALLQHVTSFWKTPNQNFPESLYGIAAHQPPFSVEQY